MCSVEGNPVAVMDVAVLVFGFNVILLLYGMWDRFDGERGIENWFVEGVPGVWYLFLGICDLILPEMFETIWSNLFLDTDKGRSRSLKEYGQGNFGSKAGNLEGGGGSDPVMECGGSFSGLEI